MILSFGRLAHVWANTVDRGQSLVTVCTVCLCSLACITTSSNLGLFSGLSFLYGWGQIITVTQLAIGIMFNTPFLHVLAQYSGRTLSQENLESTLQSVTVMILSFRTDMPGQTVQTQIRVYTVCHSICIVWTHYSMVEPHSSNFRVITTNFLGVRIFRKFMASCQWQIVINTNLLENWIGQLDNLCVRNMAKINWYFIQLFWSRCTFHTIRKHISQTWSSCWMVNKEEPIQAASDLNFKN